MLKSLMAVLDLGSLRQSPLWKSSWFSLCPSLVVVSGVDMCRGNLTCFGLFLGCFGVGQGIGAAFISSSALVSSSNETYFKKFINENYL